MKTIKIIAAALWIAYALYIEWLVFCFIIGDRYNIGSYCGKRNSLIERLYNGINRFLRFGR